MRERINKILANILPASGSLRRRLFFLLAGMSMGTLLIVLLIWLPSAIDDIHHSQRELRQVSVQFLRDQIKLQLEMDQDALRSIAQRFRPSLMEEDREGLRLTAQRFLQNESEFEEIGILDGKGKELLRLSRRMVITDQDLVDRSASSLFREGMQKEFHWEPVVITATSEPWVTLTMRLPGAASSLKGTCSSAARSASSRATPSGDRARYAPRCGMPQKMHRCGQPREAIIVVAGPAWSGKA